jgi:hypothetical protein
MVAATTDVRAWLREQGHAVNARGQIPADLHALYDQAHTGGPPVIQGEILDSSMGVTEADFPPADDDPADPGDAGPAPAATVKARERKPRTVRPQSAPGTRGIRERIFGGKAADGKPKGKTQPRVSLSDWAEETWSDLAWLAQPVPPLAKILTIQAPYAGVVFDEQVKGTPIDPVLQRAARYSGGLRVLNGLAGPPVYVGLICATGARMQPVDPGTGQPAVYPDGSPVLVYDQRTQMLFQGLRYSLLQMTKIGEVNADEIRERTQASAERMAVVDQIISDLFDLAPQSSPGPHPVPRSPGGPGDAPNGYRYPDPPVMDGTGTDPGRMS